MAGARPGVSRKKWRRNQDGRAKIFTTQVRHAFTLKVDRIEEEHAIQGNHGLKNRKRLEGQVPTYDTDAKPCA